MRVGCAVSLVARQPTPAYISNDGVAIIDRDGTARASSSRREPVRFSPDWSRYASLHKPAADVTYIVTTATGRAIRVLLRSA
jgi:hypothetical protein